MQTQDVDDWVTAQIFLKQHGIDLYCYYGRYRVATVESSINGQGEWHFITKDNLRDIIDHKFAIIKQLLAKFNDGKGADYKPDHEPFFVDYNGGF